MKAMMSGVRFSSYSEHTQKLYIVIASDCPAERDPPLAEKERSKKIAELVPNEVRNPVSSSLASLLAMTVHKCDCIKIDFDYEP